MNTEDRIQYLKKLIRKSKNQMLINNAWAEADEKLSADPKCTVSIESLDVSAFGCDAVDIIGTCRLSIYRAGTAYHRERHLNSTQIVFSLEGSGEINVLEKNGSWRIDHIGKMDNGSLAPLTHWVPAGVWHQPLASKDQNWVVLAFHTAREIKDEFMV